MPRSAIDRFDFEITWADVVTEGKNSLLVMDVFRSDKYRKQQVRIILESNLYAWQEEGQKSFGELVSAIGLTATPEDTKDLIGGKATCLMYRSGKLVFIPVQILEAA